MECGREDWSGEAWAWHTVARAASLGRGSVCWGGSACSVPLREAMATGRLEGWGDAEAVRRRQYPARSAHGPYTSMVKKDARLTP